MYLSLDSMPLWLLNFFICKCISTDRCLMNTCLHSFRTRDLATFCTVFIGFQSRFIVSDANLLVCVVLSHPPTEIKITFRQDHFILPTQDTLSFFKGSRELNCANMRRRTSRSTLSYMFVLKLLLVPKVITCPISAAEDLV